MSQFLPTVPLRVAMVTLALGLTAMPGPDAAMAQTARPATSADAVRLQPLTGDYVAVGRINLRQQPSQQGTRIGQIDAGAKLKVTGKVADAPWYAVTREDGRTGYVFADLLRPVAEPTPAATAQATPPAAPDASQAAAPPAVATPQADPVGAALTERLDKMEAALSDIRKRIADGQVVQGIAERQQALESAIAALRNDVAGLRGAATEGDKAGGFMDRLIGLQEQISAQIAEQKTELQKLGKRLDAAEEWLKPVKQWGQQALDEARPPQGWLDWFWGSYSATRSWLTEGWWWQAPTEPSPGAPSPDAPATSQSPARQPVAPDAGGRSTILG